MKKGRRKKRGSGGGDSTPNRAWWRRRAVEPEQASMEVTLYRKHERLFRIANTVLHAVGAVHFTFGCYYDWFQVDIPKEVSPIFAAFGWKLKFLTYWDAVSVLLKILIYKFIL